MPDQNLEYLKSKLIPYLESLGIEITGHGKNRKIFCLWHDEKNPSAQINDNYIMCHGCGSKHDIFDVCSKLEGIKNFKDQLEHLNKKLGININKIENISKENKKDKEEKKHQLITVDEAKKIFSTKNLQRFGNYFNNGNGIGKVKKAWLYKTENGMVSICDVRYETEDGKKQVVSVFYSGKIFENEYVISSKKCPSCLYGLDKLDYSKPCLIVEGAKCASLADKNLGQWFFVTTWNRGGSAVKFIDWKPIKKFDHIYILPDHDEKKEPGTDILLEKHKQPGLKAAIEIKKILGKGKIIEQPKEAIEIKPDGADIEEALSIMSPESLKDYILNTEEYELKKKELE